MSNKQSGGIKMFIKTIAFMGLIAASLGLGVLSQPVVAQDGFKPSYAKAKNPAKVPEDILGFKSGEFKKTDTVTLLGKPYTLTFWQMPETSISWDDVKKYIPPEVAEEPKTKANISDDELLVYIDKLAIQAASNYDSYAQQDFQAQKAKHMAEHPGLPEETVSLLIFEQYQGNNGWKNSSRAQEAHNAYMALIYVADALRLKLGLIEKKATN
jgi:hypothetical protein